MNKKIVIAIIAVAVLLGGFFALRSRGGNDVVQEVEEQEESTIQDLKPIGDEVDVEFDINRGNTGGNLIISGLLAAGVTSLEYDISYESEGRLLGVGTAGTPIDVEGKDSIERDIFFGTESSGRRKYDPNVENITLTVRFNTPDGPKIFKEEYL
jgi:hypothetical protein